MNLICNAIVLRNGVYVWEAVKRIKEDGHHVDRDGLAHIGPTRFEHINIFGKYEFDIEANQKKEGLRKLREQKGADS